MLKTLLKLGTTLALVYAGYLGYVRAFEMALGQLRAGQSEGTLMFAARTTQSRIEARKVAIRMFGPKHWTSTDELPYAYYNSQRGFWMYWQDYEEVQEQDGVKYDGKRVIMSPFVIIGKGSGSKGLRALTCDRATLDLNQPTGINTKQSSGGIKVEHALLEGNVWIRDDHGTPETQADDLRIGPLTYADYDEARRLITSESHVHMEDPDHTADGDGLDLVLRAADPDLARTDGSSAGMSGAEYVLLKKNVQVVLRDAGQSGVLAGSEKRPEAKAPAASNSSAGANDGKPEKPDPVPLLVRSKGPMRVDFPPDAPPVAVGPPAPPLPTLVRFDREVVALHGKLDDDPNELDCDVLRLTLVPPERGEEKAAKQPVDSGEGQVGAVAAGDGQNPTPPPEQGEEAAKSEGAFGNLTLQKAHATGYAVWLQLRKQATRIRCVEMIYERSMPHRPDSTFFRGVKSNEVVMEKVDYETEEPESDSENRASDDAATAVKRPRKVKSFTQVRTISAKLFDRGNGLDLVDVRAFGPGRLEARPDVGQPAERIAVWQDELTIVNITDPTGKTLRQKRITLTGSRPFFVDLKKKASLDSAREIRVFLKPRPREKNEPAAVAKTEATTSGIGSSLQIEHLLAYRDVHFKSPDRYLEARQELDAPFEEYDPAPSTAKAPEPAPAGDAAVAEAAPPKNDAPAKEEEKKPGLMMTAVADRVWARVAIPRGQSLDPSQKRPQSKSRSQAIPTASAPPKPQEEGEADIREALLRGKVAIHQDKAPDPKKDQVKPQGNDIQGEAVYLLNKGKGKLDARVFHRDPQAPPKPGPIPWARVSTDDMLISGETIWMDQERDKIYAKGPGFLKEWTSRDMMSDKSPDEKKPAAPNGEGLPAKKADRPQKPRTRAGKPVGEKDLITINWTKSMEFTGQSQDPTGHPAARADFLGTVDAIMTDSRLYCDEHMIVFTDKPVPLTDIGTVTDGGEKARPAEANEDGGPEAPARKKVDIAQIFCYGKPTAISRKIDPDRPIVLEQQRIDAWIEKSRRPEELLIYERRTGRFNVPGPGMAFLFNRQDEKGSEGAEAADEGRGSGGGRSVLPTSNRTANRTKDASRKSEKGSSTKDRKVPPLVLMQIKFRHEMIGRFGTGQADDKLKERWSEFFGNIEFLRTEVPDKALSLSGRNWRQEVISPDERLSEDGFYLTSQSLRVIQEPPPPGSPENAQPRNFAKAFDHVHVNRGEAFAIESDVVTFDSLYQLLLAHGENGRGVTLAQQGGPGQPPSISTARAVQYNVQTHAWSQVDGSSIQWFDQRTGVRPGPALRPDPTAPPNPRIKTPFKVPNTNMERRGFTGF